MTERTDYILAPVDEVIVVDEPQLEIEFSDLENKKKFSGAIDMSESFSKDFKHNGYLLSETINQGYSTKVKAISFFSGCGGLDIGSHLAGVEVISSMDFNADCIKTIGINSVFSKMQKSVSDINNSKGSDYTKLIKEVNPEKLILIGGPPCQPFSKAGYWQTNDVRLKHDDPRNMIGEYLRLIEDIKPDGFLLENVDSLFHPSNKPAVDYIIDKITELKYEYTVVRANALDYGVPQKRKRVFFVASKKKFKSLQPIKTHGNEKERILNPALKPYERVVDWIGEFDGKEFAEAEESSLGTYYDDLIQVPPGKNYIALTARNNYLNPKFVAGKRYWTFLLKLHPFEPSWTIISSPGHWEGPFHWSSRRLRIPEIAAIQTFPKDYVFHGSRRSVQKQIGNAVPPLLGKAMVEFLIKNI